MSRVQGVSPQQAITVHKLDAEGREVWRYHGQVLEVSQRHVTLTARYDRQDVVFEGLPLRRGDRFVETFYTDRWYNVFAIHDIEDDRLKGWYCNITRPARIADGHVHADDLALDLIVTLEGDMRVLDEQEFAELSLSENERAQALRALQDLKDLAQRRQGPFAG